MKGTDKYRKAIERRKEMAGEEWRTKVLTPVEKNMFDQSLSDSIGMAEQDDLLLQFKKLLPTIAKSVSVTLPMQAEVDDTVLQLSRLTSLYYPELSVGEVVLAFEMVPVGELDRYLPKDRYQQPDRNHYQQLDTTYIGKVLTAYTKRRANVLKKVGREPAAKKAETPTVPLTPELQKEVGHLNSYDRYRRLVELAADGDKDAYNQLLGPTTPEGRGQFTYLECVQMADEVIHRELLRRKRAGEKA